MALDLEQDRKDLIPLWKFRRMIGARRQQIWTWWKFGLVDRKNPGKRIHLETVLDGGTRKTTWAAYKRFCQERDMAIIDPKFLPEESR